MRSNGLNSICMKVAFVSAAMIIGNLGPAEIASAEEPYAGGELRQLFEKNQQNLETRLNYVEQRMELWRSDSISEEHFQPMAGRLSKTLDGLEGLERARRDEMRSPEGLSESSAELYKTLYSTQAAMACEPESRKKRNERAASMDDAFRGVLGLEIRSAAELQTMFEDSLTGANNLDSLELELNVFQALQHEGRIEEARRFISRGLSRREELFGAESSEALDAMYYLGYSYFNDGLYDMAQDIFHAVVNRYSAPKGRSLTVALALQRLGQIQHVTGDIDGAIEFYMRAESQMTDAYNALMREASDAGLSMAGELTQDVVNFVAERSILESRLSDLHGLAFRAGLEVWDRESTIHQLFGMLVESDPILRFYNGCGRPAVDINKRPLYAVMAEALMETGRLQLAEEFLEDARANAELISANNGRDFARYLHLKAMLSEARGETSRALDYHRQAFELVARNLSELSTRQFESRFSIELLARSVVGSYIAFLQSKPAQGLIGGPESFDESFQASQLLSDRASGRAYRSLAQALAASEEGAGSLIERKRELETEIGTVRREIEEELTKGSLPNSSAYDNLDTLADKLVRTNAAISSEFPEVANLLSLKPVSVEEVRERLGHSEAMVYYTVDAEGHIVARVIAPEILIIQSIALSKKELGRLVAEFRRSMEPDASGNEPQFDARIAYRIYEALLEPFHKHLDGIDRLVVVTYDDLDALPFPALVTKPPDGQGSADLGKLSWLIKRYATSLIPSVSTFGYVRTQKAPDSQKRMFLGVADPDFDGFLAGLSRATASSGIFRAASDVVTLEDLPPLPETRSEVERLAANLGYDEKVLLFGVDASEERLRALDLSRFSTLVFSTHALLANELKGVVEPSLALSSTESGFTGDASDGVLIASEVAALHLNADLVVLAACNTARSADPGDPGLSRLTRAFVVAGARRLIVSHWKVHSGAAVELFSALRNKGVAVGYSDYSRANLRHYSESLRQAALRMAEGGTEEDYTHPMYWAAFFVVGA